MFLDKFISKLNNVDIDFNTIAKLKEDLMKILDVRIQEIRYEGSNEEVVLLILEDQCFSYHLAKKEMHMKVSDILGEIENLDMTLRIFACYPKKHGKTVYEINGLYEIAQDEMCLFEIGSEIGWRL